MITALELASLCKAKNRPPITRFLFFLPWKVISGTVPRFSFVYSKNALQRYKKKLNYRIISEF